MRASDVLIVYDDGKTAKLSGEEAEKWNRLVLEMEAFCHKHGGPTSITNPIKWEIKGGQNGTNN